jgi:peptidyl-prolyl cis-trans isomerase A (cyclophilin A)
VSVTSEQEIQAKEQAESKDKIMEEKLALEKYIADNKLVVQTTASGLMYVITNPGTGKQAEAKQTVKVHYTGKLLNGTKFDSSLDRNEPLEFQLGVGMVIKGWDEGIALLKEGGKALLIIPSNLAYGARGAGNVIPPFSPLTFEVELVSVQ